MRIWIHVCGYMCSTCMAVPTEARRGRQSRGMLVGGGMNLGPLQNKCHELLSQLSSP